MLITGAAALWVGPDPVLPGSICLLLLDTARDLNLQDGDWGYSWRSTVRDRD